ncbi:hypothetical protein FACS1894156_3600 [Bacteroidia bacterium]|nr:hypothetical protein FACS1894156_3600 [Bacteroidia bacterium]
MKKFLSIFAVATAISFAAVAQDGAVITFAETEYNFGTLVQNETAEHQFTFTNTGNAPLILLGHTTTCGCTVPSYPKDTPIAPGEGGTITVKYNRTDSAVPFNKSVTINSNAVNTPSAKLTIKGEVKAK